MGRTLFLPTSLKIVAAVGAAFVLWGLVLAYASSPAQAATITVDTLSDTEPSAGHCTLREAITSANSDPTSVPADGECANGSGADVIHIGVNGTVTLTSRLPDLSTDIAIEGPGADKFTVSRETGGGPSGFGIFFVRNSVVSISGITIANGVNSLSQSGGGIENSSGTLTVTNSTISGNTADHGGGIYNNSSGTLTVTNSTISGNTATSGGGINNNEGTVTVSDSTISGNMAVPGGQGGGVRSDTGLLGKTTIITNSTISGNTAGSGGGVYNNSGTTVIEHSTITKNTATNGVGGGVASNGQAGRSRHTELLSTIVSANTNSDVSLFIDTTIPFVSKGYNLIGSGNATGAFTQTGDQTGVSDPKLGDLADNGGPTQTHALLTGSPAIDAGPPLVADANGLKCPPPQTDQRGISRPQGSACDIGAYEVEVVVDNTAPFVTLTSPLPLKTLKKTDNVTAEFSEPVKNVSTQTFILERKIASKVKTDPPKYERVAATVTPSDDSLSAVLDPAKDLPKAEYRATITTDVTDQADPANALDQESGQEGNQPMVWTFTVPK